VQQVPGYKSWTATVGNSISPSVCLLSGGQYSGIGISRSIDVNSLTLMLQTVADSGIGGPGATKKDSYRISHKPGVAMQKVA